MEGRKKVLLPSRAPQGVAELARRGEKHVRDVQEGHGGAI
jgi:hypothetical protein